MAMGTSTVTVRLSPIQKQFRNSNALVRGFSAGIGAGKSYIGALDLICRAKPGRLYLVAAPTYGLMSDASFRTFEELARGFDLIVPGSIARGTMPHLKLKMGAEVIFRSTDNYEMLRGPNLSGIWWDEASLSKSGAFDILFGRLRGGGELGWMTLTYTPKGKSSWIYKQFAKGDKDTEIFHARTSDNPFLAPGFYEAMKAKYSDKMRKQELEGIDLDDGGNWFSPGGWPRYSDNGDTFSVMEARGFRKVYHKNDCTIILGLDWALNKVARSAAAKARRLTEDTTDFNAFVVCALTLDGRLFILDCINERIRPEAKAPMLARLCRRWRPRIVVGDDDMLSETMLLDCRRQADIPEIRCLPISGKSKVERAMAAIIRGENGLMYLPDRQDPWVEVFVDGLSSFNGIDDEHDDIPDALGTIGRIADELKGDGRPEASPDILVPARDLFGPAW